MKNFSSIIAKTLALFLLFLTGYYLLILTPRNALSWKIQQAETTLTLHHTHLLQNRLAFVELTRLDPDSPSFNIEKSNLITNIQQTNEEGQATLETATSIPELSPKLTTRFPTLLTETQQVYQDQLQLLEEIFATDSYEAGIAVIKSDHSITLLTQETNLILEYKYWLTVIQQLK